MFNQMNTVCVHMQRVDAIVPKWNGSSLNLFFCPKDKNSVTINPGEIVSLPTGARLTAPYNNFMKLIANSDILNNKKLTILTGTSYLENSFSDEIEVTFQNFGNTPQTIDFGENICFVVFIKFTQPFVNIVSWR